MAIISIYLYYLHGHNLLIMIKERKKLVIWIIKFLYIPLNVSCVKQASKQAKKKAE